MIVGATKAAIGDSERHLVANDPGTNFPEMSSPDVRSFEEEWTTYDKTSGHADMTGELFEVKMAALLYLRGLTQTQDFWLTSNMTSAGLFDDLTFVHRDEASEKRATCLQLKHRQTKVGEWLTSDGDHGVEVRNKHTTKSIQSQSLTALSGQFSLIKYLSSFFKVRENHSKNKDISFIRTFKNLQFVIYTNAAVDEGVLENLIEVEVNGLFITGGKVYKLNPESNISRGLKEFFTFKMFLEELKCDVDLLPMSEKAVLIRERINAQAGWENSEINTGYQDLKNNPCLQELQRILSWKVLEFGCDKEVFDEFINNLLICTGQASEAELEKLIKTEIKIVCKCINEKELNSMYDETVKQFTGWWRCDNKVLNAESKMWVDIINAHVGGFACSRNDVLKGIDVTFLDESTETLKHTINRSRMLVLTPKGSLLTLTTKKLLNILQPTALDPHIPILVNLGNLMKQTEKILSAWKSRWFCTMIVECESDDTPILYSVLAKELQEISERFNKRIVLVAKKGDSLATELKRFTNCIEIVDDTCWSDLTVTSQNFLRLKKVNFQGVLVSLGDLVGNNNLLASKLDGVSLNLLLAGALTVGKEMNETDGLYVPRKVGGGDDLIHLLSDVPERIVLITGEPGIGKTSLLNKLAKSTKEKDFSLWIASLSMTDCYEYLDELDLKYLSQKMSVEFVKKFSTNTSTAFEDEFFKHCVDTGKMIVLLDAIDEISPSYEGKVMSILEKLREIKFHALWVTSRLGMQGKIERVLKVASKKLAYFSKEDQANLLKAFWKSRHPGVDEETFGKITTAFWKLASNTFIDNNLLTGIPQLIIMLAETFEKDLLLKQVDSMQFQPKSLDLLQLYDGFVRKKHDMYFKMNKNEQEKNFKIFMNNHMHSAVWSLFSKHDYADLVIPNRDAVKLELERFCEEIKEGREKTGIIDGFSSTMNRPRFLHRTFCEYFVAKWIAQNFEDNVDFLTKKMFHSSFKIINILLNRILASGDRTKLHVCVLNRDLNGIEDALKTDPGSIHQVDDGGRTAFHLVTLTWERDRHPVYVDMARTLLHHGTSIDATDRVLNLRPLEIADKTMAWTIAGLILQHGGDVRDLKATENNMDKDVFEEFIEFLIQPEGNVSELLTTATKHDQKYLIRYLVEEKKADVNCAGDDYATPMHWAASGGHINLMSYLHKHGGSYLCLDRNHNLPLHYAANRGGKNAVEFLVDHGSDIDAVNSLGETPLLIAAGSVDADLEVINYLIKTGANLSACNHDDISSLYLAVEAGKLCTVQSLCNAMQAADVEKFGPGAFQCALEKNDLRIVNYLRGKAMISLPKTVLTLEQLLSLAFKLTFAVAVLICTIISSKHLLQSLPDVFTAGAYNALNTLEEHSQSTLVNRTSLYVEGHPFLPTTDEEPQDGPKLTEHIMRNSTTILTVWFVDYQISVSQDIIWKFIMNAMALVLISLKQEWPSFLVSIGLLSWSLGLFLSNYSLEVACILAAGCSWSVLFFLSKQGTSGFQGVTGKFFHRLFNVSGVFIWALSLIHSSSKDVGLILIILGAIQIVIGVSWRHGIPFEGRCYEVFLTLHSTGILCAVWFSWMHGWDWPIWFAWFSSLVLVSYVAAVVAAARADRLLPTSLDKALKTKIKLRVAWLLLLVPVWAYFSAGNLLWTVELSWGTWLGMIAVPLPVFTLFFEWGRHQMLMTGLKT